MGRNCYADPPQSRRHRGLPGDETSPFRLSCQDEQRLRRRLRGWAQHRLRLGGDDFEDMYQTAWYVVLENSRTGTTRSLEHALRWALQCRWTDELRRRGCRPTTPLERVPEAQLTTPAGTDPSEQVERLEAARYLLEAVEGLTERQRRLLLLADLWGLRPAKVQAALGISARTYRRDHAAALASITARMGELLEGAWCRRHADLMTAYATGHASGRERQAARRHLSNCLACRRTVIEHRCSSTANATSTASGSARPAIEMAASGLRGDLSS